MSRSGGKTNSKHADLTPNEYEQQRRRNIEANKMVMKTLGIKRIAASFTSLVDSSNVKKSKKKYNGSLEKDSDYAPEENEEVEYEKETHHATASKKGSKNKERIKKNNFIPPMSVARLLRSDKEKQARQGNKGVDSIQTAVKAMQRDIQRNNDGGSSGQLTRDLDEVQRNENNNDNYNDYQGQEGGNNLDQSRDAILEDQDNISNANMIINHDDDIIINEGRGNSGNKKKKKTYKTKTPRGPTRNLQMAKMRPGERKKVDFNVKGLPVSINRACLANYCGALVRDPLNAPLYQVKVFSEIPEENKEKMWQLVLEKFDIGLENEEENEEREKKIKERRKYIMESLNKKYRSFRARLKSGYYDTENTDIDRLKKENIPPNVDENDWKWLVKYFGFDEFKSISKRNVDNRSHQDAGHTAGTKSFAQKVEDMFERDKVMPSMLDLYEETHSKSDKERVTEVAKDTLSKIKDLLVQREAGEINLTDEEIYAKVKPIGKRSRNRGKGVSPSITSLYGTFSEGEKLRKEADETKLEAMEAKEQANEANVKNKALTKKMKDIQKEMKLMKGFVGKVVNLLGYDLSEIDMNEVNASDDDDANETGNEDEEGDANTDGDEDMESDEE